MAKEKSEVVGPPFKRGATPTPREEITRAKRFMPSIAAPPMVAMVPAKLDNWNNATYGDCVTAEEAFAKAAYSVFCALDETFISADEVVRWARAHGVLNGAYLKQVLDMMTRDGLKIGAKEYKDGPASVVDVEEPSTLESAIAQGPVKIAIDGDALPDNAGRVQGWFVRGSRVYRNIDHCVSVAGYGPAGFLYDHLKVPMPAELGQDEHLYLVFTWGTIGCVDWDWIAKNVAEAWVRTPTTVGQSPGPPPAPPPAPPIAPPPPWLIPILAAMCAAAPTLPPPWNAIAAAACQLLPTDQQARWCGPKK